MERHHLGLDSEGMPTLHSRAIIGITVALSNGPEVEMIIFSTGASERDGVKEGGLVLEPSHRGDYPKTKFHILCRRLFKINVHTLYRLYFEFDRLLKKYGA